MLKKTWFSNQIDWLHETIHEKGGHSNEGEEMVKPGFSNGLGGTDRPFLLIRVQGEEVKEEMLTVATLVL